MQQMFVERDLAEGNAELARVLTELHKTVPVTPDDVASARDRYGSLRSLQRTPALLRGFFKKPSLRYITA